MSDKSIEKKRTTPKPEQAADKDRGFAPLDFIEDDPDGDQSERAPMVDRATVEARKKKGLRENQHCSSPAASIAGTEESADSKLDPVLQKAYADTRRAARKVRKAGKKK